MQATNPLFIKNKIKLFQGKSQELGIWPKLLGTQEEVLLHFQSYVFLQLRIHKLSEMNSDLTRIVSLPDEFLCLSCLDVWVPVTVFAYYLWIFVCFYMSHEESSRLPPILLFLIVSISSISPGNLILCSQIYFDFSVKLY